MSARFYHRSQYVRASLSVYGITRGIIRSGYAWGPVLIKRARTRTCSYVYARKMIGSGPDTFSWRTYWPRTYYPRGGQYILSGRTEFPRKMCPPRHIGLADRFSSDTGPKDLTKTLAIITLTSNNLVTIYMIKFQCPIPYSA